MKERGEKLRVFRMNYKRRGREWREIILVKKCEIIQFILNLIKYVVDFTFLLRILLQYTLLRLNISCLYVV